MNYSSLQARIRVNGVELVADLTITYEQQAKGLSIRDQMKENE
ncbi:MAG: hypothetical protein ACR2IS_08015 [Nitrososphaeraceae archaeon]